MKQKHLLLSLLFISLQIFSSGLQTLRFIDSDGQVHRQLVSQKDCDDFFMNTACTAIAINFIDNINASHPNFSKRVQIALPRQHRETIPVLDKAHDEYMTRRAELRRLHHIDDKINEIHLTRITRQMVEDIKDGRKTKLSQATQNMLRMLLTNKFLFARTYAHVLTLAESTLLAEVYRAHNS